MEIKPAECNTTFNFHCNIEQININRKKIELFIVSVSRKYK